MDLHLIFQLLSFMTTVVCRNFSGTRGYEANAGDCGLILSKLGDVKPPTKDTIAWTNPGSMSLEASTWGHEEF